MRPEGWVNQYPREASDGSLGATHHAYEAGADAMYEGLEKDCIMAITDIEVLASAFKFTIPYSIEQLRSVFIEGKR